MTEKEPLNIRQIMNRVRQGAAGSAENDRFFQNSAEPVPEAPEMGMRPSYFQGAFLDVDRNRFDLRDLLDFHDRTFITYAYQALLKRDPDPEGMDHYLRLLRSGRVSKVRILASFRYCAEGRKLKVRVQGLGWELFKRMLRRPPVLGGVADYLLSLLGLRRIRADLERREREHGRLFEETGQALARLEARVESRLDAKADKEQLAQKADLGEMDQYLRTVSQVLDMVCTVSDGKADLSKVEAYSDRWTEGLYLSFEDAFRGPRESIRARLEIYLPEVRAALEQAVFGPAAGPAGAQCRVLDLGCGRGEFLEMLSAKGIRGMGVDSNGIMVQQGKDAGLDIREQDIFAFLSEMPAKSMAAITAFQVMEHLPFSGQLMLIDQCRRILAPGGILILETPNPQNLLAGSVDFHRDPTHLKPVHPDTLLFLARARGFSRARICYPRQDDHGGTMLTDADGTDFTDLSDYITVARDFALIAYKGQSS